MAIRPDVVRLDRAAHSPDSHLSVFLTRQTFLEYFPHGVIGTDPRQASKEAGERILAVAVEAYEKVLTGWKQS
jgi:creatinine amidohydrolase/Fe(II)-dependent formamide hydrolase-like protein